MPFAASQHKRSLMCVVLVPLLLAAVVPQWTDAGTVGRKLLIDGPPRTTAEPTGSGPVIYIPAFTIPPRFQPNIENSELNITGLINNELRGNENDVRNSIFGRFANTGSWRKVKELKMEVNTIISNAVTGDDNNIYNMIYALMANMANINNATVKAELFGINEILGDDNNVSNFALYNLVGVNAGRNVLRDIYVDLSSIAYNKIGDKDGNDTALADGQGNRLGNIQYINALMGNTERYFGPWSFFRDADAVKNATLLIDAVLLNEVTSGNGNWLNNFLNLAVANGMSMENVVMEIEAILVNQVRGLGPNGELGDGDNNELFNLVNIGLGLCDGIGCGSNRDFASYVSSIILNDVIGDGNFISNVVSISVASQEGWLNGGCQRCGYFFPNGQGPWSDTALQDIVLDVEAIVVNTIGDIRTGEADSNFVTNTVRMDLLNNLKARDVKLAVSAIIANQVQGASNLLDNKINIRAGDGSYFRRTQQPINNIDPNSRPSESVPDRNIQNDPGIGISSGFLNGGGQAADIEMNWR